MPKFLYLLAMALLFNGCGTTGSATRTSDEIYQPTESSKVKILFEKPSRPYEVIGYVGSMGSSMASEDSVFRAMQKEAAELGAHAILVQGQGVSQEFDYWVYGSYQKGRALAIRWKDGKGGGKSLSVTPTSVKSTTPKEEQIIPKGVGKQ